MRLVTLAKAGVQFMTIALLFPVAAWASGLDDFLAFNFGCDPLIERRKRRSSAAWGC